MREETKVKLPFPASYIWKFKSENYPIAILFHGWQQSASYIYKKLDHCLDRYNVLSIDGPFPLPVKTQESVRLGFGWYFYDQKTDKFYYDMSLAIDLVRSLINKLQLEEKEKILIGYSQGGYLIPFAAQALLNINHIIGINCRFKSEALKHKLDFPIFQIHGEQDTMVDPKRAQICHNEIIERGNSGSFYTLKNTEHKINEAIIEKLKDLL